MNEQEKLLLNIGEAARQVGLGRSRFYEEVMSGRCDSVTVGRRRLIPRAALEAYVQRLLAESGSSQAGRESAAEKEAPSGGNR